MREMVRFFPTGDATHGVYRIARIWEVVDKKGVFLDRKLEGNFLAGTPLLQIVLDEFGGGEVGTEEVPVL